MFNPETPDPQVPPTSSPTPSPPEQVSPPEEFPVLTFEQLQAMEVPLSMSRSLVISTKRS